MTRPNMTEKLSVDWDVSNQNEQTIQWNDPDILSVFMEVANRRSNSSESKWHEQSEFLTKCCCFFGCNFCFIFFCPRSLNIFIVLFTGSFQISDSIQALSDCSPSYDGNSDYQSLTEEVHRGFFDHSPELYPMVPEQKYRPPPHLYRRKYF